MEVENRKIDEVPPKKKTDEHNEHIINPDSVKSRKGAFSQLRRELSDEDLNSPGTQRLILNELDKYEECSKQLEEYKGKYYNSDKERAVLEVQLSSNRAFEILYSFSLSVGSALLGITPSILNGEGNTYYLTWIVCIIGGVSLIGGIVAKFWTKRNKK